MSDIIDKLNEEQKLPALQVVGPVMVTAGAGSGKTRLLTHRIAHLVEDLGVSPYNILAITFTNKATNEMKDRLQKMCHGTDNMWISTFHAMCSKILRFNANRIGFSSSFTIYGDTEKERTIKRILKTADKESSSSDINHFAWHISNAKNQLMGPDVYFKEVKHERDCDTICDVYAKYQEILKLSNALDFDDLMIMTYKLFSTCPDVLEKYQDRFLYIHVDEFQDTNYAQYKLVSMLAAKYKNIFVVGDEDQCIYSWRGADFSNISKFKTDFAGTKSYKLEQNYRSRKKILDKANQVISYNENRSKKTLWTENSDGDDVLYYSGYNDIEEAEWVAQKIKVLITNGYMYKDIAVLMRVNALSRIIEEKFLNYQIPHQVFGGFKFFERKEVKDVLAYYKLIANPKDNDSFVRVLGFPKKGIGDVTISKILEISDKYNMPAFEVAKTGFNLDNNTIKKINGFVSLLDDFINKRDTTPLSLIAENIIKTFMIKEAFGDDNEEDESKKLNIDNLLKSTYEYDSANENATLDEFLQSVTLSRDIDNLDDSQNYVSIMTIHAAKGLEFKVVFVVGLSEGILPLSRAAYSSESELEEERRLMYVATTRAEELLFYTRPNTRFDFESKQLRPTAPSRFLKEAGMVEKQKVVSTERKPISIFDDDDDIPSKPAISREAINNYSKYKRGMKVMHPSFGEGEVIVEVTDPVGAFITIRFNSVGIKTLSLKFAPLSIIG